MEGRKVSFMDNEVIESCELEWQKERGVLYIHNKATGATVLRIQGLSTERVVGNLKDGMIDINLRDLEDRVIYPL